jgi:hypothetical protein
MTSFAWGGISSSVSHSLAWEGRRKGWWVATALDPGHDATQRQELVDEVVRHSLVCGEVAQPARGDRRWAAVAHRRFWIVCFMDMEFGDLPRPL